MGSGRESILAKLEAMPLGQAVHELLTEDKSELRGQIATLEKQLDGFVAKSVRPLLVDALDKLKEAERQKMLPLHLEIAKAISSIAKKNGLAVKRSSAAKLEAKPVVKRSRFTPEEIKTKVLTALSATSDHGLPGSQLAKECGISYQTLIKHLKRFNEQGILSRQGKGTKTTWHQRS